MNLHHFYHIYADGQWQEPVSEHIKALKEYGLYEALATFEIGLVGSEANCIDVLNYVYKNTDGFDFSVADIQETGWEQVTMIPMWEFSKHNDGLMLYAHSKGASNLSEVNQRWRRSMTWFNVCQWKECIKQLETHDAVGCHWIQPLLEGMPEHTQGNFMFAGTFFWVKCETLRAFPRPALTHRHEAEGFIGYGWHEKHFPVYDFTPYFPNTAPFADGWINNPNYSITIEGKSYKI